MQLSQIPKKIALAFASAGAKTSIPVDSQIGKTAGAASYTDGFPPLTRTPLAAGGVPPKGTEMNGVLYELSATLRWLCAGAKFDFDSDFSTYVGGYPKGATIQTADGKTWRSLIDNNTTAPPNANWASDKGNLSGEVNLLQNTTLTASQSGNLFVIGGTCAQVTLPPSATIQPGAMFCMFNSNSAITTIQASSGDSFGFNSVGPGSSFTMSSGDTATLVFDGALWRIVNGTVGAFYSATFASARAANGFQKLPSGLIIQWGTGRAAANNIGGVINFPIAFPVACAQVIACDSLAAFYVYGTGNYTRETFNLFCQYASGMYGEGLGRYIAIGY